MNLIELVEAGDVAGVLKELDALTPEQRVAHGAELTARLDPMSGQEWHEHTNEQKTALLTAELGCRETPEAAAARIVWHKFRNDYPRSATAPMDWMVDVVSLRPVEWQVELVARIGERSEEIAVDNGCFILTDDLVRTTGAPVPTSDAYINAWLEDRRCYVGSQRPMHALDGARGTELVERLRNDDHNAALLPLIVTRPGVRIVSVAALASLAAEGLVDRTALVRRVFSEIDSPHYGKRALDELGLTPDEHAMMAAERVALAEPVVARLLLGGSRHELAPHLAFLHALALTPAEYAPFLRDHVAMLDLSLPVAAHGQEVLIALDGAGLLEEDVLTEACERVLLRPEKKLVRAQLSWLARVIRRDPARAGQILRDAAITFQHRDADLQERALDMIAKHLRTAGDSVLPELREAAESLSPGLTARAAELFGPPAADDTAERFEEVLPVVPVPLPVPGPIETATEVAQEVAAVFAGDLSVVVFERALDGLVRHARLDRAALSAALAVVMRKEPHHGRDYLPADLYDVATAVRGSEQRPWHIRLRAEHPLAVRWPEYGPRPSLAGAMLRARLDEAIDLVESGTQPFLLAVPTHSTGALDAAVLVERIAELERLGVTPAPIDLAQALLRVTPEADDQVRAAAEALGSEAGRRLARWLREGGLPHQNSTPEGWPVCDPTSAAPGWWYAAHPGPDLDPDLPPVAAALVGPDKSPASADTYAAPYWVAQLPHHRDEVAARTHHGEVLSPRLFPALMESGGPAGFAVHRHVARALPYREEAVDALLVLAAQGQLDSRLLAGQLQVLMRYGKAKRYADSLRAAAETGAYATVWSVLEALLPASLRDEPVREAGAFLALAVECASRCGAKGSIAEVDAMAARRGSSQMVKQARLLRDVLR
ncbi:DUF6493 family protein [Nonomuraea terrae]|uniref:DUF7824 domain-containing protein n=1 Tax=Nonomuraea terrae TaxID=2530383 RepID=UPI00378F6ABD